MIGFSPINFAPLFWFVFFLGISIGLVCGILTGAKFSDSEALLRLAEVEISSLRKERDALLHATSTQFGRKR